MSIAKGADPVTENEFKLFKRAMGEQGSSHSSVADVIANAHKKNQLDAWYLFCVRALAPLTQRVSREYNLAWCVWLVLKTCMFRWMWLYRGASGGMPIIGQKN